MQTGGEFREAHTPVILERCKVHASATWPRGSPYRIRWLNVPTPVGDRVTHHHIRATAHADSPSGDSRRLLAAICEGGGRMVRGLLYCSSGDSCWPNDFDACVTSLMLHLASRRLCCAVALLKGAGKEDKICSLVSCHVMRLIPRPPAPPPGDPVDEGLGRQALGRISQVSSTKTS